MRREELFGLDRRAVDRENGVLRMDRVYSKGRLKPCMKSDRQRAPRRPAGEGARGVGLDADADRLAGAVPGEGRRPDPVETFRLRHWTPALRAAGIDHHCVYDCRHTFASWSIRAGVQLFYLSRIMGTSVAQIDAT